MSEHDPDDIKKHLRIAKVRKEYCDKFIKTGELDQALLAKLHAYVEFRRGKPPMLIEQPRPGRPRLKRILRPRFRKPTHPKFVGPHLPRPKVPLFRRPGHPEFVGPKLPRVKKTVPMFRGKRKLVPRNPNWTLRHVEILPPAQDPTHASTVGFRRREPVG